MKKLLAVLAAFSLFSLPAPAATVVFPDKGGQFINLQENPGFESALVRYTASGGTFTRNTSTPANGGASALWAPSAGAQTILGSQFTVPAGLQGRNCLVKTLYQTTEATNLYTLQAIDGSSNVLGSSTLSPGSTWQQGVATFPCPSSGTVAFKILNGAGASPASLGLDDVYLGNNYLLGQVSQAQLIGTVKVTACAASFTLTGTSFADFTAGSSCSYAVTNSAVAPATNIPAIKFASLPPGDYVIQAEGYMGSNTSGNVAHFQFWDGTNTAREESAFSAGSSTVQGPSITQSITYTTAQSGITLSLRGKSETGGQTTYLDMSTTRPFVIKVFRYPSNIDTAYSAGTAPANWSGYQVIGTGWNTTSTSFVDPTGTGTITLTQLTNRNFGTVANAAGSVAGLLVTFPRVGNYKICATFEWANGTASNDSFRLVDGSATIIHAGITQASVGAGPRTIGHMCGDYAVTSIGAATIKIQSATDAGTSSIQNGTVSTPAISWTIMDMDTAQGTPALVGGVTSATSGSTRLDSVIIGAASATQAVPVVCSSSPCTQVASSSAWVSSVTRSGTGAYTVNMVAGQYSAAPTCVITNQRDQATETNIATASSTTLTITSYTTTSGAASDTMFGLLCFGAH